MTTEPDINNSPSADDGTELGPQEAAAILAQATRQAKNEFDPTPPWKLVVMAFVALLAFGALWLSVLGQHPYTGPNGLGLAVTFVLILSLIAVIASTNRRATAGVTGPSVRQRRTVIAAFVVVYIAVYVFMGALKYLGTSLAMMSAGAICAFAGPIGVWLAIGISVFVIVSARAAVLAWRRRA